MLHSKPTNRLTAGALALVAISAAAAGCFGGHADAELDEEVFGRVHGRPAPAETPLYSAAMDVTLGDTYFGGPFAFSYRVNGLPAENATAELKWITECKDESEQRLEYAAVLIERLPEPGFWATYRIGTVTMNNPPTALFVNGQGASLRPTVGSLGAGLGVFWAGGSTGGISVSGNETAFGWWLNHCERPTWANADLTVEGRVASAQLATLPVELVHLETMESDYYSFSRAGTYADNVRHSSTSEQNRTLVIGGAWNGDRPDPPIRVIVRHEGDVLWEDDYTGLTTLDLPPGTTQIEIPSVTYPAAALTLIFWMVDSVPEQVCSPERATHASCVVEW